jgi:hypothetical protein
MKYWKVFLSEIEGKVPTLNQLDFSSIGLNIADGIAYIRKRTEAGVESIEPMGGGGGGTGGVDTFIELTDTPASYSGQAGKVPKVKSDESGLEFVDADSLILNAATLTFSGLNVSFTAGENLVKGEVCYMSAGKLYKADADALATSFVFAIATATIAADAVGFFMLIGIISGYSSLTVGAPVYLSTAPGAMSQTLVSGSNDVVQILGIAISATHIYFKPELAQVELL